jgi:RND superfamily putative drug exporter
MSDHTLPVKRPVIARAIYYLSLPIIVAWLAAVAVLTLGVPSLDLVALEHSVSVDPTDSPSYIAAKRVQKAFQQSEPSESGSTATIILEGEQPLGDDAHAYYDRLIRMFKDDSAHVQDVNDFWGDELTRSAAESTDAKAAYVNVLLVGLPGEAASNASLEAISEIVANTPPPPGVKAYVTGPAAVTADMSRAALSTIATITALSLAVIFVMLLFVYRSVVTVVLLLLVVGIELQVARGIVALLGLHGIIGLTTFAVTLLVALAIAAGTDYGIFFVGRYQEARQAGEDRETAFYTTYSGVAKVVLASGLTIAGAVLCLSFTRLPFFHVLGIPCAVGITVAVAVALTLFPAVLAVGSRFGLFEPKRRLTVRGWRRVGTAIVRWPGPILAASLALALLGLLTLPGFQPNYNEQKYLPKGMPSSQGIAAAARHFPESIMASPEILFLESDHDLRNSADFLVLNKLAKAVLAVPGVTKVQAATRPDGNPVAHSTIPYLLSAQQAAQQQFMVFQKERTADLLKQADMLGQTIVLMQKTLDLSQQTYATSHRILGTTKELQDITHETRDHLADFDDFFRPIRNYLYWEPHCFNIPLCSSVKSIFDAIDGVDGITDNLDSLVKDAEQIDVLIPQLIAQLPEAIAVMQSTRTMLLTTHSTSAGVFGQMDDASANPTAMGKAFDAAQNDDSFYAPPEVFTSEEFKRVADIFLSPDGKTVQMLISQKGDPTSTEGMSRVDPIKTAAEEALKGTPLEDSKVFLTGSAAFTKDLVVASRYDLLIAGVAAICLIFIVMLLMTRSLIAALVIVGTVILSLGASFGLSVAIWQYLLGIQINWATLVTAVIILLAVGSDYNLLLVARIQEELPAGIDTGIIRAMAGTGKVVTNAGLVFAATMMALLASDLISFGQLGSTIAIGLLFDTLVVRAFMTPSIAALLGRWFWWPQQVRPRPASSMLRPSGPRPLVRALLQGQRQ